MNKPELHTTMGEYYKYNVSENANNRLPIICNHIYKIKKQAKGKSMLLREHTRDEAVLKTMLGNYQHTRTTAASGTGMPRVWKERRIQ